MSILETTSTDCNTQDTSVDDIEFENNMTLKNMNVLEKKSLIKKLLHHKKQNCILAPMSKGQEALWFIYQSAPKSPAYNVAMAFHIYSSLNQEKFEKALNLLVQRHEILRTSYAVVDHKNQQQIHAQACIKLINMDTCHLNKEQRHEQIINDYRQPFDLSVAPPLRAHWYQVANNESIFLLTIHHIAIDASSLWILMEELAELYVALVQEENSLLHYPALSYREYCNNQQQLLASEQGHADKSYWTDKLSQDIPPLTLDISQPRPVVQLYEGASYYFDMPSSLADDIKALAKQQGVTAFSTLLTAWYCLLARHSGQEDICISTPTSGRLHSNLARSIGYFVNPVILRTAFQDNPSVVDLLQRVQNTVMEALEHQQYPFSSVVEAVNPQRNPSITPFSQTSFVFQKPQPGQALTAGWTPGKQGPIVHWANLDIRQYALNQQEGQFELELELTDSQDNYYGILKYNRLLFNQDAMQMLAGHYRELLQAMICNPQTPVFQLNLLTTNERQQLIRWNDTQHQFTAHQTLPQLIEKQVMKTPNAVALVFESNSMTYNDMNQHANRLAHFIIEQGVCLESKVGVCMDRSFSMVIALLAIIKAGGAYVPVDPNYPKDRVSFLLNDMETPLILTQSHLLSDLPKQETSAGTQWVCVDDIELETYSNHTPQVDINPNNLAYMIYTSGSTGNPKGAMNTHAGICNRLLWMQDSYSLSANDCVLQKTPFSFDVSVWEFFWPLLAGARLVIARPDGHKDVSYLIDTICREKVTTLHFVPSMLSLFIANANVSNCHSLKHVICSGEALSFDLQERFFKQLKANLYNLYGPTEAAIDVTAWQCKPKDKCSIVPIGKPIANTQIHIVDKHLQPVPVGVNGELLIGGIGVARGYYNRDSLTASKFISNPFNNDSSSQLYRTGDLVRYLPDGNIDYLQRIDDQIKLHGFRIELGEIEAALNSCKQIRESVVVKRTHPSGGEYLQAFATINYSDGSDNVDEKSKSILHYLADILPPHCIPSALVFLPEIPLTPNGKVDRKALPEHQFKSNEKTRSLPPRNDIERKLLQLWRELLQVEDLSITDNFFNLGGHSLLAVRLMAIIETELKQHLPLASLVQNPTIAELALLIENQPTQHWNSLVAIQERGSQTPLFFVPGGGGNVLYFYPLAKHLGSDRPFYGMQARGLDGITTPLSNLHSIANEMIKEIKHVQPEGPYLIGGHCVGSLVAFSITQQLIAAGDHVEQLIVLDAPAPHFFTQKDDIVLSNADWICTLVGTIAHMTGQDLTINKEELDSLSFDEQLDQLRKRLAEVGIVPQNVPLTQIRGLLQVFISNALLHYENTEDIHPVSICLLRAREINPHYDYRCHDDKGMDMSHSSLGWKNYSKGSTQVQLVDGDHITMLGAEQSEELAHHITQIVFSI